MRTHAHRSQANLEVRQCLALDPVHANHGHRYARENDQHINQRPQLVVSRTRSDVAAQVGHELIEHQRSTSPSTMSIVPITATTSATSKPRTITSSACRLTNDGGRTRKR